MAITAPKPCARRRVCDSRRHHRSVFLQGLKSHVRLDLFGDEMENIRSFDPAVAAHDRRAGLPLYMKPASEVFLDKESIARFRAAYRHRLSALCWMTIRFIRCGQRRVDVLPAWNIGCRCFYESIWKRFSTICRSAGNALGPGARGARRTRCADQGFLSRRVSSASDRSRKQSMCSTSR